MFQFRQRLLVLSESLSSHQCRVNGKKGNIEPPLQVILVDSCGQVNVSVCYIETAQIKWKTGAQMETCLKKSIEQYRQIIKHAEQLDQLLLKSDPDELQHYTARLQQMQDVAGCNDRIFMEQFSQQSAYWKDHPLFLERSELLKRIVALNHLLLPKIRGIMAVTANELTQVKGGRVAVAGYHHAPSPQKQSIRGVG